MEEEGKDEMEVAQEEAQASQESTEAQGRKALISRFSFLFCFLLIFICETA
jgi:hypothetical protein